MLQVKSTKVFPNMSCAHAQWFDTDANGGPGKCASLHGYARSTKMTFAGCLDEHGWMFPFGDLKVVRSFLEYYFDHTVLLPADDPRFNNFGVSDIRGLIADSRGLLDTARVLPYGVSMEMSSLFIWEHVNPYIRHITEGRVYLAKVECWEHEWNSAYTEADETAARDQARGYFNKWKTERIMEIEYQDYLLPKKDIWQWVSPKDALTVLSGK